MIRYIHVNMDTLFLEPLGLHFGSQAVIHQRQLCDPPLLCHCTHGVCQCHEGLGWRLSALDQANQDFVVRNAPRHIVGRHSARSCRDGCQWEVLMGNNKWVDLYNMLVEGWPYSVLIKGGPPT